MEEVRKENKKTYDRKRYLKNREKNLERSKIYQKKNPEKRREAVNKYRKTEKYKNSSKEKNRRYALKANYGITILEYNNLYEKQNGYCLICKNNTEKLLSVDHNHETKKVRGLLCGKCNKGLGLFKEDIEALNNAIIYLNTYN